MRHKFRFSEKCINHLKNLCGWPDKAAGAAKVRREKQAKPEAAAQATEETQAPASVVPVTPEKKNPCIITRTDRGLVRASNQDAVVEGENIAGVADGMGGHNGGEVASAGARDLLLAYLADKDVAEEEMCAAIAHANTGLYEMQQQKEALQGMGTTMTVLWFDAESIVIGHVGDSRAYRLRDGVLEQITRDHSMVAELVAQGILTPEQAACHPMRNVITRAVGTEATIAVDTTRIERKHGDLWLVCSDGLYGMVSDGQMQTILNENQPETAADLLIQAALDGGGRDNVSLAIFLDREDKQ